MDHKLIPTLLSVGFVFALLYMLIFLTPLEKINTVCTPVTLWPGRMLSGAVRIADPDSARKIDVSIDNGFNTCRKWVWNVFYDAKYREIKGDKQSIPAAAGPQSKPETPPASVPR